MPTPCADAGIIDNHTLYDAQLPGIEAPRLASLGVTTRSSANAAHHRACRLRTGLVMRT